MSRPRVALVTGGSSGIGAAIVTRLSEEGYAVELCARRREPMDELAESLRAAGGDVVATGCDVTDEQAVGDYVREIADRRGRIDVVVNNAGRSGGGHLAELPTGLWDDIVAANLRSVFLVTRAVLATARITSSDQGRILNIASTAGKQGVALATPYCASKHAVIGFTKSLALELKDTGVTVNAVCPGYVDTPLADTVIANYARAWETSEDAVRKRFEAKIPKGRYSKPAEVAAMVSYLLSPQAAIVTGQAMNVCGGLGNY